MATELGGDILFTPNTLDPESIGPADIHVPAGDSEPERDAGLRTSVMIALFTNKRADDDDELPDSKDTRGGHFSDAFAGSIGSKLWLLRRKRINDEVLGQIEEYSEEALNEQIVDEGIAKSVEVTATRSTTGDGVDRVLISVTLIGLDEQSNVYQWFLNWQRELGRI